MAVAFLDERQMRALEQPPAAPSAAPATPSAAPAVHPRVPAAAPDGRDHGTGSIVATPRGGPEVPGPSGPTQGSPLMKMREPDLKTGPSEGFVDTFLANSKPLEKELEPSGQLQPGANGRQESHQGTFDLTVDRDGAAHIKDTANLHAQIGLPGRKQVGDALSDWSKDPYGAGGKAGENQKRGEYHALGEDDKPQSSNVVGVPLIGGGFDATDWMMRRHGQDPYASKKLHVLDETRDERAQVGMKYRHEQLVHSTELVRANLDHLWASAQGFAAAKHALFELWDECAERGDTDLVEGGRQARKLVIGFIRAKLPAGSPNAFTREELDQLNARRQSSEKFEPYG